MPEKSAHPKPVNIVRPEGFKLIIPEVFSDFFLIPLKPLGSWKEDKGVWNDKAASSDTMNWQSRTTGFTIPAGATGYGIPAGKNNLLMVDIDQHKADEDGEKNLQTLIETLGGGLPFDTYEFKTGSGARQLVFHCSPELQKLLKPSKGSTAPGVTLGVDIRVNASYSVGPGSLATQPDNSVGRYEELTPGKPFADIEDYPWFVELLRTRALPATDPARTTNPTLAERKATEKPAAASAPTVQDAPQLTNQKGDKAIKPLVKQLLENVAVHKKGRHQATWAIGVAAGKRRVEQASIIEASLAAITADIAAAPTTSPWIGKELAEIEARISEGWEQGNAEVAVKDEASDEFTAYALARTFIELHPQYKWVTPRETPDSGGSWLKFDTDPKSPDCGIYKPMDQLVVRNEILDWLSAEADEAQRDGATVRADAARKARDSRTVDEMMLQIKGNVNARAALEDFDRSPNCQVDAVGVRNLDTMEVTPFTPNFLATRKLHLQADAANYEAHKETIERILSSCHPEDRPYLDAMLGTILRNEQPLSKKGTIIWGPSKDNGKTTLVELLLAMLGEGTARPFALKAAHAIAHRNPDNKYAEADLDKKTLTILDDFAANKEVDAEKLKQYIGSGAGYKARQIGEKTRTITLTHTFFLTCNRLPNFGRGEDVMDRFEVILFPYKYPSDDQYDPKNIWHRKRDPHFTAEVGRNLEIRDAMYYYVLMQHKKWAESNSRVETDSIGEHMRDLKAGWKGKTNTIHAVLSEYAVADASHFVSEKELHAFLSYTLKEQGQGVFGVQALRTELEALHLFREWGVQYLTKKRRSKDAKFKNLKQSQWQDPQPYADEMTPAPDAANIFAGLRLKTNDAGRLMDEDEWEAYLAAGEGFEKAIGSVSAGSDFELDDFDEAEAATDAINF